MRSARVLLVEDDPGLSLTLGDRLRSAGHEVVRSQDGERALRLAALDPVPDLILLDVMLPGIDGHEVCRRMRGRGIDVPILMLTARTEVADRVRGLREGADDYVAKPFDPDELLARIDALLRRAERRSSAGERVAFGDVEVDLRAHSVRRAGRPVALAALEFRLLRHLIAREGEVVTREELLRAVWGHLRPPNTRTVDVHVTWLRAKLEPDRAHPRHLRTVRGSGYLFVR